MKNQPHYNLIVTDAGWHSTLCAGNNRVLLTTVDTGVSENESSFDIEILQKLELNIENGHLFIDRRISKDNKHYFCIKGHHNDLWISETYNTRQGMEKGIASVLRNCKTEDVRVVDRRTKK